MVRYDPENDILHPSTFEYDWKETGILGRLFVYFYKKLGVIKLTEVKISDGGDTTVSRVEVTNCTLVNLMLLVFNPMREDNLTKCILVFQLLCSLVAFFIRYGISKFIY